MRCFNTSQSYNILSLLNLKENPDDYIQLEMDFLVLCNRRKKKGRLQSDYITLLIESSTGLQLI